MYGRSDPPQQWSVHAEFTITHPGADDIENLPKTNTVQDENGTRLSYSWTSKENTNIWSCVPQSNASSGSTSNRSVCSDVARPLVYQRGNLVFTSTPASKFSEAATGISRLGVQDSGYGSDLLSPNSLASGSLPKKSHFPHNRKCKSTCSIVLSANSKDNITPEEFLEPCHVHCGRTQSLRCQTPSLRCRNNNYNFYGCGDPWCHHSHIGDDISCLAKISPVLETCDDPHLKTSSACTFTGDLHPPDVTLQKKDASVQTFEMIDKCTSPIVRTENFFENSKTYPRNIRKNNRGNVRGIRQRKMQPRNSQTPSSLTPDSLESFQPSKKLSRLPNLKRLPTLEQQREKSSANESTDPLKKPHTVHIDVYCMGVDMESDDSKSSGSSENETASTPQTVFESSNVYVTHERSENTKLPFHLEDINVVKKSDIASIEKNDSDIDDEPSTAYPSKISSYSTINDFSSSISSVPKSWTPYSLSSCAVPDDYDSVANTSCKDTFSDIDSLLHSSSSIAQTESIDFFPMKLCSKGLSIDETPEIEGRSNQGTLNHSSLQPNDSFEYANSEDRLRITEMEEMWKSKSRAKQWKCPQSEKKLLTQQRKMQEYIRKRLNQQSKSKDSDSEFSDDSEKGWTFVKHQEERNLQELKSHKSNKGNKEHISNMEHLGEERSNLQIALTSVKSKEQIVEEGSCSNSTPSTIKSPTTDILTQGLTFDHTLRSPFSIFPGEYTLQRHIASRFGPIVNTFRKPGHHIGPTKNPDCFCDHCQRYFKNLEYRNITQSTL